MNANQSGKNVGAMPVLLCQKMMVQNLVIIIWLFCLEEAGDVQVCVQSLPTDFPPLAAEEKEIGNVFAIFEDTDIVVENYANDGIVKITKSINLYCNNHNININDNKYIKDEGEDIFINDIKNERERLNHNYNKEKDSEELDIIMCIIKKKLNE